MYLNDSPKKEASLSEAAPGEDIALAVYSSFDEIRNMQQEWDDFVESAGGDIFLTYDWFRIWWKHYGSGKTLRIFVFRYQGKLVGALPTYFAKIRIGPVAVKVAMVVGTTCTLVEISPPILQTSGVKLLDSGLTGFTRNSSPISFVSVRFPGHTAERTSLPVNVPPGPIIAVLRRKEKLESKPYFGLAPAWTNT